MLHHDPHYRRLLGQPDMLRALLQGMLPAEWVALLDLDSLQAIPTDHLGDRQQARQGDLLWRVRRRDGQALHVLLLLEHQARGDRLMSVRTLSYTALSYETLVRRKLVPAGQALPAILPIVLYSGTRRWTHPVEVSDLLDPVPPSLQPYQPRMRYMLIDEGEWVRAGRLPKDNLASLLFQLEHNQGIEHAGHLLHTLCKRLRAPEHAELYRAFGQWVRYVLLPRGWPKSISLPDSEDLTEITRMTTTIPHSRDWTLKFRQEGQQEGQAALLSRLLERRFGVLPDDVRSRLASASLEQLETWSLNILDATALDEVFGD